MKRLSQLISEIIPVIIGILIALYINNWNENRKDQKYLNQIFHSIGKELEESIIEIEEVVPKQLASIDTLENYLNNEEVSLYEIVIRGNGIHYPRIKTNSWNAIAKTKIELMEYEKLSALADIEERKENLNQRIEKQMDFIFQNFEKTDKGKKEVLKMIILDVVNTEKRLQSRIEEILKKETAIDDD